MTDKAGHLINTIFDHVYVVSLTQSLDRREHIKKHFSDISLDLYSFHDAILWDSSEVRQAYDQGLVKLYPDCFRCGELDCGNEDCNNVLIPQQVGNFLSHKQLWQQIAARQQLALVVEDDVVFETYASAVLTKLKVHLDTHPEFSNPDQPLLLRFGWAKCEEHSPDMPFSIDENPRMSNPCYALNSSFARNLLANFKRIETTSDIFLHRKTHATGEAFTILPPIASELSWSTGKVESLIHPKQLHAEHLRKRGNKADAFLYERKIERHLKRKYYRDFLIVGHPRCGTGFSANLLNQCGLDIGHEANGKDGLSSWMFAVDDHAPYATDKIANRQSALVWNKLILPLRDLQTAVPSVMNENCYAQLSYDYRRHHIRAMNGTDLNDLSSNFERAVASILSWVELIEKLGPDCRFRIEDQSEVLLDFAQANLNAKFKHPEHLDLAPYNANKPYAGVRYPKQNITSVDWASLPEETWKRVVQYCNRYGYGLPDRKVDGPEDTPQHTP